MRLVIGMSGASGVIYGVRLLQVLSTSEEVETHLVMSRHAKLIIEHELDVSVAAVQALANFVHDVDDLGACISSGSFKTAGMVVAPCSIKTMSALANCYNTNLLVRAGDVTLKEGRPLVIVLRETPLHLGHLRLMVDLAQAGAVILPPVPAFYHKPKTIDDIVNQTVGKILDRFNIDHCLFSRWSGMQASSDTLSE